MQATVIHPLFGFPEFESSTIFATANVCNHSKSARESPILLWDLSDCIDFRTGIANSIMSRDCDMSSENERQARPDSP
jgi:hypothetical protein